jgi:dolichol-phosphate mannosyltransferase
MDCGSSGPGGIQITDIPPTVDAGESNAVLKPYLGHAFHGNNTMKLSLVITVFNEEDNVIPLINAIHGALGEYDYEVILVDDGSQDQTVKNIRNFDNARIRLIVLQRNYGQTAAMAAGIAAAHGEYIVTLDGDLQNDPADIPMMLRLAEDEGYELVAGKRKDRKDGLLLRNIPSRIANALIRSLTGVYLRDYGCTLKVFKRDIARNLGLYGELHRFIPVLAKMQGAHMTEVDVRHHPRIHGSSKYGLGRTFRVLSDLLLMVFFQKYFNKPMHLFGTIGIIMLLAGVVINAYLLIVKLTGQDIGGRPLLILGAILFLGGLQIIIFGFLAEIMMRIYYESQQKPSYRIKASYQGGTEVERAA